MTDFPGWNAPELSADDQKLIAAYVRVGRSVDDLAYTAQFDEIAKSMDVEPDDLDGKHAIFKRLLTLRKQARLPRVTEFAS